MKVIATDISNLTDARYFAAWGVDALAYSIDPLSSHGLSPSSLKEISEWVEGPLTLLKMDGLEVPESYFSDLKDIKIDQIILGPFIDSAQLKQSFEKIYRICTLEDGHQEGLHLILNSSTGISKLTAEEIRKIKSLTSTKEVFFDGDFSSEDLKYIKELGFTGIILKGSEEEKVGFKSFDHLDEILEKLMN